MRPGGGDILAKQLAIDVDRGIDLGHHRVGLRGEPPTPHLVAHARSKVRKSTVHPIMTGTTDTTGAAPRRRKTIMIAAAAIAALGVAAVYGIAALGGNGGDAACAGALATAKRIAPLARGEVAAVSVADTGLRLPALAFKDATGAEKTLADWKGRTVLFNLWATWCVPCRKEMPALAALQQKLGGPGFEVVAVNIDTRNLDKPRQWLEQAGVTGLAYYADASSRVFQ